MKEEQNMRTILIVDDDPDLREGLRALLEIKDFNVKEAISGAECLEIMASANKPDLIILDIMMETKHAGFEVAYQLYKDPELRKIPIILLSNLPRLTDYEINPEIEERYLPVARFLTKPVNPELLYQEISRLLGTGSGQ